MGRVESGLLGQIDKWILDVLLDSAFRSKSRISLTTWNSETYSVRPSADVVASTGEFDSPREIIFPGFVVGPDASPFVSCFVENVWRRRRSHRSSWHIVRHRLGMSLSSFPKLT